MTAVTIIQYQTNARRLCVGGYLDVAVAHYQPARRSKRPGAHDETAGRCVGTVRRDQTPCRVVHGQQHRVFRQANVDDRNKTRSMYRPPLIQQSSCPPLNPLPPRPHSSPPPSSYPRPLPSPLPRRPTWPTTGPHPNPLPKSHLHPFPRRHSLSVTAWTCPRSVLTSFRR